MHFIFELLVWIIKNGSFFCIIIETKSSFQNAFQGIILHGSTNQTKGTRRSEERGDLNLLLSAIFYHLYQDEGVSLATFGL